MKKYILFPAVLFVFLITAACSVNESTGLIIITNLTNNDFNSIKVGNSTIAGYLSKGSKTDYWYFNNDLTGKLQGSGLVKAVYINNADTTESEYDEDLNFKVGYTYNIEIIQQENNYCYFYVHCGRKYGKSYSDIDPDESLDDPRM